MTADLDLRAVAARYSKALDAKPSKGPWEDKKVAWITDSVADVPQLLAEIDRLNEELDRLRLSADYTPEGVDIVMARHRALRRRAEDAEAALRDFAVHGTRHDLTPTMPGGSDGMTHLLRYIERMDAHVRETARRALEADHG